MESNKNRQGFYKVGIIGGGISGIAAAKQLSHYNPLVFEASDSIGGVWKHCSYRSTRLQTPRRDYEFSDYHWPNRNDDSFPTHFEIVEYLENYAKHFDVMKFVKFNSKVVEVKYIGSFEEKNSWFNGRAMGGSPAWEVAVKMPESEHVEWYSFEFIVVCIGKYGDIPKMPVFARNKGPEVFKGKVMHSLDYCKLDTESTKELMKGKKVVVVGYKKSAIDLAVECAEANQGDDGKPCTMIIRTLHWTVPSYWIWGLPFFLFYSTRGAQSLHERPNQSLLRDIYCLLASPLRRGISRFIESYLKWKLPLEKYGLVPDHPFEEDYASCQMAILPENFFAEADHGRIRFKKTTDWYFYSNGIEVGDGTKIEADIVFLATGFDGKKKLKLMLPQPFREFIEDSSGVMPLYSGTIHPLIPHMAFVGYIESVSNLHTSELRCKWLSGLLDEKFKLPSTEDMFQQITQEIEVAKRTTRFYRRHCISTYSINHSDHLCDQMGWSSWRKKNWLAEAFSPYNNQDYKQE